MSLEEVAALVCATLDRHGVPVVLSGGSVVSIYAHNPYPSMDLDFIREGLARKVDAAMLELGFEKGPRRRHWTHPSTPYWVEFPAGPVGIGAMRVTEFAERATSVGTLRLLAPTECVMDRLTYYYFNDDLECLEQALAVARNQDVDLHKIEKWSQDEARNEKFQEFLARLRATR